MQIDRKTLSRLVSTIPQDVLDQRNSGQLHKLAESRLNTDDFGLDVAIGNLAKKAYYRRRVNTAIYEGLVALDSSTDN